MNEKVQTKKMLSIFLVMSAVLIICCAILHYTRENRFTATLPSYYHLEIESAEQIRVVIEDPDILMLEGLSVNDQNLTVSFLPGKKGTTYVSYVDNRTNEEFLAEKYQVSQSGTIISATTGNFTDCRRSTLVMVIFMICFTTFLFFGYFAARARFGFSYQEIFYSGFAIWSLILTIILLISYVIQQDMILVYGQLQNAGRTFIVLTSPILLIFALALSVSNIALIRHERFRVQNALGIILSAVILIGIVLVFIVLSRNYEGSDFGLELRNMLVSLFTSAFSLAECFLIGSIISGLSAALHEPAYDKDFIVILGCRVRKDGTLFPLIRGRVDRAIAFFEKQLKATGKKAIFVPSGGQGGDEQISEGDAMKRYLLEQGYPEELIMVENRSRNTVENMVFSKKLIDERKADAKTVFSTTNFHVFRSGIISRQNGFEIDGMGSKTKWYFWPNAYIREVIGMVVYLRKRLIAMFLPIIAFFAVVQFMF